MGWHSCRSLFLCFPQTVRPSCQFPQPACCTPPAAGMGARLSRQGRKSLPLAGGCAHSIPGTRSICCCSYCSSPEHTNCPLPSWTAVSCQREIMDPFFSKHCPSHSCQLSGPQEEQADLGVGERSPSCILIHKVKES